MRRGFKEVTIVTTLRLKEDEALTKDWSRLMEEKLRGPEEKLIDFYVSERIYKPKKDPVDTMLDYAKDRLQYGGRVGGRASKYLRTEQRHKPKALKVYL
jgi:hypothetical protein|tara:strand:- start:147 stop:443 length:297 start_codon:yes stop_codon:yes gene_type:complete